MKITNKQLIDRYLSESAPREILTLLMTIQKLMSRHHIDEVMRMQNSDDSQIADLQALIQVLQHHRKLTKWDLHSLVRMVTERWGEDARQFVMTTNAIHLKSHLEQSVDVILDLEQTEKVGLSLQGDGRLYKRTLKTDVEKLLR